MASPDHLPVWKLVFHRVLSIVLLSHLGMESAVSGFHSAPLTYSNHHTILLPNPAYLFHASEDPQQVSTKDSLELFLTPAPTQQFLYQYWVRGHVL